MEHYENVMDELKKGGAENALHYLYENSIVDFIRLQQLTVDYAEGRLKKFNEEIKSIIEELKGDE